MDKALDLFIAVIVDDRDINEPLREAQFAVLGSSSVRPHYSHLTPGEAHEQAKDYLLLVRDVVPTSVRLVG